MLELYHAEPAASMKKYTAPNVQHKTIFISNGEGTTMNKFLVTALTGMLVMSGSAWADANLELAKSKQCLSCHAVDKESMAPSFKSVATKYRHNAGAEAALVSTIMKGTPDLGGSHWGTMTMPSAGPRPVVNKTEAKQLAGWILGQK